MTIAQPLGPGFKRDGQGIEWDSWSFHVRPDQRVGMIISTVRFRDGERERPVLYQGSLSEIFVPYMDPAFSWYARNFLDAGEYSVDGLIKSLEPGIDCPDNAVYMPQLVIRDNGRPNTVERAIRLFERLAGDMIWRHAAATVESRPNGDLVVRSAAVLGNYDYIFDWLFQQDGTIRVAVGATGINEIKIVREKNTDVAASNGNDGNGNSNGVASADRADQYGRFVGENLGGSITTTTSTSGSIWMSMVRPTVSCATACRRRSCRATIRGAASGS